MKKLVVLLLAFAVAAGAFAQAAPAPAPALAWSGYVATGMQYDSNTDALFLMDSDYSGKVTRTRLSAAYTNGDFGVNFRIQSNDPTLANGGLDLTQALVWGGFEKGLVKFKVGKLNDYTYATAYNSYGNFDGKTGALVMVAPISGLSVGYYVPLAATATTKLADAFKTSAIAASYTAKGIGTFVGELALGTTKNALYTGANISAVKDLTVYLETKTTDLANLATTTNINEYFSYAMGPLSVGAYASETLGSTFGWSVAPEASYALSPTAVVGGSASYDNNNAYLVEGYAKFTLNAKSFARPFVNYSSASVLTAGSGFVFAF